MPETDWQHREGRDKEGDKFSVWLLVHGSGRIVARVWCPTGSDEYSYEVAFLCNLPEGINRDDSIRFVDLESAKRFVDFSFSTASEEMSDSDRKRKVAEHQRLFGNYSPVE